MKADRVEELVAEFIERREAGERVDAGRFVADHPEVSEQLRAALDSVLIAESLFPDDDTAGVPARFGSYQILGVLGRGATSQVYRARHRDRPEREVALKVMQSGTALHARTLTRFQREGELMEGFRHPAVAELYEAGVEGQTPFLAMQLCDGPSLSRLLTEARSQRPRRDRPLVEMLELPGEGPAAQRAALVVAKLAEAVDAIHARGMLHRDLKPANVVLDAAGDPMLIDFGLASGVDHATLTQTGDLLGTVPYMSPEQARGERTDVRSDVYGLGAVLYELLTLRTPHSGEEAVAVLESVQRRPAPLPRQLDPTIPVGLETVVARALSFRKSSRYPSAAAFAADLRAFLEDRAIRASRSTVIERLGDLWSVRRREILAAVGVVLALAAVWWFPRGGEPAVTSPAPGVTTDFAAVFADVELRVARAYTAMQDPDAADEGRRALQEAVGALREAAPAHAWLPFLEALDDGSFPAESEDPTVALLIDGETRRRAGDAVAAVEALRTAVERNGITPLPTLLLAMATLEGQDLEQQDKELTSAVRLLPDSKWLREAIGEVLRLRSMEPYEEKDFAASRAFLERAAVYQPTSYPVWHRLAFARQRDGDPDGALEAAQTLVEFPGDHEQMDHQLRTLAVMLDKEGSREQAATIFEGVVERNPRWLEAIDSYAVVLDSMCRLPEGRDQWLVLLGLQDDNLQALYSLCYLHAGSNREACDKCEACFAADPELEDPGLAEEYYVRYLRACRGTHRGVLALTQQIEKTGVYDNALAALDELIESAVDDRVLGTLFRAKKVLEGE